MRTAVHRMGRFLQPQISCELVQSLRVSTASLSHPVHGNTTPECGHAQFSPALSSHPYGPFPLVPLILLSQTPATFTATFPPSPAPLGHDNAPGAPEPPVVPRGIPNVDATWFGSPGRARGGAGSSCPAGCAGGGRAPRGQARGGEAAVCLAVCPSAVWLRPRLCCARRPGSRRGGGEAEGSGEGGRVSSSASSSAPLMATLGTSGLLLLLRRPPLPWAPSPTPLAPPLPPSPFPDPEAGGAPGKAAPSPRSGRGHVQPRGPAERARQAATDRWGWAGGLRRALPGLLGRRAGRGEGRESGGGCRGSGAAGAQLEGRQRCLHVSLRLNLGQEEPLRPRGEGGGERGPEQRGCAGCGAVVPPAGPGRAPHSPPGAPRRGERAVRAADTGTFSSSSAPPASASFTLSSPRKLERNCHFVLISLFVVGVSVCVFFKPTSSVKILHSSCSKVPCAALFHKTTWPLIF